MGENPQVEVSLLDEQVNSVKQVFIQVHEIRRAKQWDFFRNYIKSFLHTN